MPEDAAEDLASSEGASGLVGVLRDLPRPSKASQSLPRLLGASQDLCGRTLCCAVPEICLRLPKTSRGRPRLSRGRPRLSGASRGLCVGGPFTMPRRRSSGLVGAFLGPSEASRDSLRILRGRSGAVRGPPGLPGLCSGPDKDRPPSGLPSRLQLGHPTLRTRAEKHSGQDRAESTCSPGCGLRGLKTLLDPEQETCLLTGTLNSAGGGDLGLAGGCIGGGWFFKDRP